MLSRAQNNAATKSALPQAEMAQNRYGRTLTVPLLRNLQSISPAPADGRAAAKRPEEFSAPVMHEHARQDDAQPPPSGEARKRSRRDIVLPGQLPPLADKAAYLSEVRKITDAAPAAAPVKRGALQQLDKFVPLPAINLVSADLANEAIKERIEQYLSPAPWRACSGVKGKASAAAPAHIAFMQQQLYEHIKKSRKTFATLREKLAPVPDNDTILHTGPGKYLSGILNTPSPDIVRAAWLRLRDIVVRGDDFLTAAKRIHYKNFVIISTDLTPAPDSPTQYLSSVHPGTLARMPIASVIPADPEARIFVYADRVLHRGFSGVPGGIPPGYNTEALSILHEFINHEITHLTANTYDIFLHLFPAAGKRNSGADVRRMFNNQLLRPAPGEKRPAIYHSPGFNDFIEQLQVTQGLSDNACSALPGHKIFADKYLYASILLSDAQTLATIIRDLDANRAFNAVICCE